MGKLFFICKIYKWLRGVSPSPLMAISPRISGKICSNNVYFKIFLHNWNILIKTRDIRRTFFGGNNINQRIFLWENDSFWSKSESYSGECHQAPYSKSPRILDKMIFLLKPFNRFKIFSLKLEIYKENGTFLFFPPQTDICLPPKCCSYISGSIWNILFL